MAVNRTIQRDAKRAHLDAIKGGVIVARDIEARAARVKVVLRALTQNKSDIDRNKAQKIFDQLAAEAEKLIRDVVRFQASASYKAIAKTMKSNVPDAVTPPLEVPPEDEQQSTNYLGSIGGIAALLFLSMMTLRSAGGAVDDKVRAAGLSQAEMAIDRLSNRARVVVKAHTIAASNRAIVTAVENTFQVPAARRVGVARARRTPTVAPPVTDDGRFLRVRFALPVAPGLERGTGTDVDIVPMPQAGPRNTSGLPPVDPNPPRRTRSMTALVGWQVISMLDNRVRPKHAERHGRKYYYDPGPGERGLDEMPNPPYESPRDGHKMAWNCRCVLVPIIEES